MNREQAREQLKEQLPNYIEKITERSKGANMYICPLCGSGSGKNRTGAFSVKDGLTWKCFSCGESGDIFDLIGKVEGLAEYNEQLKRAGELFGISIDNNIEYHKRDKSKQKANTSIHINTYTQAPKQEQDYTDLFLRAYKNIDNTDYWKNRGLSRATIDKFKIGYISNWKHPNKPNAPESPRLIIPTSRSSYLARDTRENLTQEQKQFSKLKAGGLHFFNLKALNEAKKPVFIVEGEIDALSIIEAGADAIALGTTTTAKALIALLKAKKPQIPLILALDNDEAGQRAQSELEEGLTALNIQYYKINIAGEYKDANEALQKEKESFIARVQEAKNIEQEAEQAKKEAYLKTATKYKIQDFINGVAASVNTQYTPTGFSKLDNILDGGLYEGLYIIGAISSLGKTTLITQIADQIAENGQDVLIFSLEMASTEIMAKSISRHTIIEVLKNDKRSISEAKTTRGITTGKRYKKYSKAELELITTAIEKYGKYAEHIYISEGIGNIGAQQIRETVEEHISFTGKAPVVIIDYLQILAPYSDRATDKQNTDKSVLELKRISRDYKTPIIGISSFNRANYSTGVTMESFKESGAIEYSSDVLIGLQLEGAGRKDFNATEEKKKNPREIELVILKNRNGSTGENIHFSYYPLFNYFIEE